MSHRAEQKAQARQARLEAEAAAEAQAKRRRRLMMFGGILAVAAAIFVAVALITSGDDDGGGGGDSVALFEGIPQDGAWLGRADAPVVVEEYADLQCPFCASFSEEQLPPIVRDFIRAGDVRMRLRLLTFLGDDSVRGARFAHAAAEQNKMWDFTEAFYAEQGPEGSGYATDDFLREVAEKAGIDVDRALEARNAPEITEQIAEDREAATEQNIDSTPTFTVTPRGGETQVVASDKLAETINSVLEDAR